MAHVYKAVDLRRRLDAAEPHYVAIKMMRVSLAAPEALQLTLEREASRTQALSHPNIINVYDFDQFDGWCYLVMEWLDGETVNDLLRRTKGHGVAPEFAWPLIDSVAHGLQHAHVNNVVHADINPSNIFITNTHKIKLLDFGVARDCDDTAEDAEDDRFTWVTQTYASPEVLFPGRRVFAGLRGLPPAGRLTPLWRLAVDSGETAGRHSPADTRPCRGRLGAVEPGAVLPS